MPSTRLEFLKYAAAAATAVFAPPMIATNQVYGWPGACRCDIARLSGSSMIWFKLWGAGWPRSTIYYYYRIYKGGTTLWQETRTKYSATSYSYGPQYRDCGVVAPTFLVTEAWNNYGEGPFYDDDAVW